MADRSGIILTGEVVEALPNATFRIRLENGKIIIGYLSGKMRKFRIKVLIGDKVNVEMGPYDAEKGRIVQRL